MGSHSSDRCFDLHPELAPTNWRAFRKANNDHADTVTQNDDYPLDTFIIDSGTSKAMPKSKKSFADLKILSAPRPIELGDDSLFTLPALERWT
jgi:hypothetical protein